MWFEFILTTKCNWNCPYCTFDRICDYYFNIDILNKHEYIFDIMNDIKNKIIIIEGGEIGFITSNDLLENLLKRFDNKVIVNTNGLFFNVDRSMLYKYIDKVFYHVAPDAKKLFKIEPLDVPFNVVYGIVDDNIENINRFIEYNSHINFGYVEIEYSKYDDYLYNTCFNEIKKCNTLNPFVSIDLSREVLCMCTSRGCHVTIPLTESNLKNVLSGYNNFGFNDMCYTCYRLSKCFDISNVIKQKIYMKDLL